MPRMLAVCAVLPAFALTLFSDSAQGVDPRKITVTPASTTASNDPFVLPTTPGITAPTTVVPAPTTPTAITTTPPAAGTTRDRIAVAPTTPGSAASLTSPGTAPLLANPNTPTRPPRWRLGVYSQDTDIGVKILRVVAGSPAERAGIEANDYIVAVAGYQVGIVNGQQFDCGVEFEQRADSQGRVMLLVQDNRNKQLVNLPIQLESRLAKVTGTIAYRNRIFLPQDAIAMVELREGNTGPSTGITLGAQRIDEIRQIPIPFEIEYDPLDINPRRTYVISATISAAGRPLYTTVDQYAVITNGKGQQVAVSVERAAADPQTAANDERAQIEQQIVQWFRIYYGRDPYPQEMPVWTSMVTDRGRSMFDVQAELASTPQVWHRCEEDESKYIQLLSETIVGKTPSPEELDYWMWRYQQSGGLRRNLAEDFLTAAGVPR
jgi:uncharacterized lipoprotein YbaY